MSIVFGRNGEILGFKARLKREKIMGALLEIMQDGTPWHEMQAIGVARRAGASPASFYNYFETATDAAIALHKHLLAKGQPVPEHLAKVVDLIDFEAGMPRKART